MTAAVPQGSGLPALIIWAQAAVMAGVYFFLPLHLKHQLQFSGLEIGALYAAASLNALLVTFPLGVAGDRHSLRLLLACSLGLGAVCLAALGFLQTFWPYLLAFWGFGLGMHAARVVLDTLIFKTGGQMGVQQLADYNAMRMFGMVIGTLGGGWLFQRCGFQTALILLALIPLGFLGLVGKLPRLQVHFSPWRQYGLDFWQRPVRLFALWLFLFCLHWGAETTSYGLFLQTNLGLGRGGMGSYMAVEFAVVALTAACYGRYCYGRLAPLPLLTLALATSGLGHILMTIPQLPVSLFWRAVHGIGDGLIMVESYAIIARLFRVERIGGNSGLINMVSVAGTFVGSLLYGPLGAQCGYQWPLIMSGAVTLGLIPLTWWAMAARPAASASLPSP